MPRFLMSARRSPQRFFLIMHPRDIPLPFPLAIVVSSNSSTSPTLNLHTAGTRSRSLKPQSRRAFHLVKRKTSSRQPADELTGHIMSSSTSLPLLTPPSHHHHQQHHQEQNALSLDHHHDQNQEDDDMDPVGVEDHDVLLQVRLDTQLLVVHIELLALGSVIDLN